MKMIPHLWQTMHDANSTIVKEGSSLHPNPDEEETVDEGSVINPKILSEEESFSMNVEKIKCAMKERGLFKGATSKLKKWDGIDALLQDWVSI